MKKIVIFDEAAVRTALLPMTYTRPVGGLRVGITTIAEKWQHYLPGEYSWDVAADYLREIYPCTYDDCSLFVAGHMIPDKALADAVGALVPGERLVDVEGETVAFVGRDASVEKRFESVPTKVKSLPDIFLLAGAQIESDFEVLTEGRSSAPLSDSNRVIGDASKIFVEEGATVEGAILNTTHGPVYIAKDAEIMEGSMLRGPFAMCAHSVVNMGTKIYPGTVLGPFCKVGGELNNVVMQGYSNKAHDGFLGNAVIGEWCNLGAGCVASNLKNDYTPIRLWNYATHRFDRTGLQFCGLIMGDHSKAGINTMFNTATVVGVGVNIHGSGFPRNFVASFLEGSTAGFTEVSMTKFFDIARRVMARRGRELTDADCRMFYAIREAAEAFR